MSQVKPIKSYQTETKTEVIREDGKIMWFIVEMDSHRYHLNQTYKITTTLETNGDKK